MTEETKQSTGGNARVNRAELAILAIALCVFLVTSLVMSPFTVDDAFVTYRYAENLAEGRGLVFNDGGPPTEGFSNLLWLLISAAVHKLGAGLPEAMPTIGAYVGVLSVVILWVLYRRRRVTAPHMLAPMLLFASAAPFVLYASSGLETALFASLLLLAVVVFEKAVSTTRTGPWLLLAGVCVALAMTRPDGALVMPAVVGYLAVTDRVKLRQRSVMIAVVVFVIAIVAYQAWRVSYFGEWTPRSLWVRSGGRTPLHAWLENMRMYLVMQGRDYAPMGYYYAVLAVLALIGLSLSTAKGGKRHGERFALALAAVYGIVYFNFIDPLPGMRYHAPLIGLLFVPIAHVSSGILKDAGFALDRKRVVPYVLAVSTLMAVNLEWVANLKMNASRVDEGNQACSKDLGKWLREAESPDALLAVTDLGLIPYYSGLKTLDVGKKPLTAEPGRGFINARYVLERDPDVVLLVSNGMFVGVFDEAYVELVESPVFQSRYKVRGAVRQDMYMDRCIWVYERREIEHPEEVVDKFPFGVSSVRRINP